jgi:hypothetical protein
MNDPLDDGAQNGPAYPPSGAAGGYPYPPPPPPVVFYGAAAPIKNPGLAALLAGLFGPLGMLYATVPGALVMFGLNLVVLFLGFLTCGLGLFLGIFTWVGGIIWAYVAAEQDNEKLQYRQTYYPPPM